MKLGQTKWFKDIMTFTKRVNVLRGLLGIASVLYGMDNIYRSGVELGINKTLNACKNVNVEDDFDEKAKFK